MSLEQFLKSMKLLTQKLFLLKQLKILNQMVKQGSITVDGVSLTVFDLHDHTLIYILYQRHVDLLFFHLKVGDKVHLSQTYYSNMLKTS